MLHPHTRLGAAQEDIGLGVFATEDIPQGTIVYAWDPLEIELRPDDPRLRNPLLFPWIERYAYIEPDGVHVLSWDLARFVNHSCEPAAMSTAFGFEIAVRDIRRGDPITDEYGLLNLPYALDPCACGASTCRRQVSRHDLDRYHARWDHVVERAIARLPYVPQPLIELLDVETRHGLRQVLDGLAPCPSVLSLKAHVASERRGFAASR